MTSILEFFIKGIGQIFNLMDSFKFDFFGSQISYLTFVISVFALYMAFRISFSLLDVSIDNPWVSGRAIRDSEVQRQYELTRQYRQTMLKYNKQRSDLMAQRNEMLKNKNYSPHYHDNRVLNVVSDSELVERAKEYLRGRDEVLHDKK